MSPDNARSGTKVNRRHVDQPEVEDGFVYVARLVGNEKVSDDGWTRSVETINVFSCDLCAALVADQGAHIEWHIELDDDMRAARRADKRTRRIG
jgi:hypothetical protein